MSDPLTGFLALYPAAARPLGPPLALGNAGGGSGARLWRYDSGLGPLVVRAWPSDGPGLDTLGRIHGWLASLTDLDFIPVPLATRDGRTIVERESRLWELAPWRPGVADLAHPPSLRNVRAAFTGLAAIHQRLAFSSIEAPSPGLASRLDEVEQLQTIELSQFETALATAPADARRDLARQWLSLARVGLAAIATRLRREARMTVPLQPVLRDARPDHFLFDHDRLTGVIDFGAMGIDSPSADLARLLGEWIGVDRPARGEALAAYTEIRPLGPREVRMIDLFESANVWLGPARWVRWHYRDARSFDDPDAVRDGLDRGLSRLIDRLGSDSRSSR